MIVRCKMYIKLKEEMKKLDKETELYDCTGGTKRAGKNRNGTPVR